MAKKKSLQYISYVHRLWQENATRENWEKVFLFTHCLVRVNISWAWKIPTAQMLLFVVLMALFCRKCGKAWKIIGGKFIVNTCRTISQIPHDFRDNRAFNKKSFLESFTGNYSHVFALILSLHFYHPINNFQWCKRKTFFKRFSGKVEIFYN